MLVKGSYFDETRDTASRKDNDWNPESDYASVSDCDDALIADSAQEPDWGVPKLDEQICSSFAVTTGTHFALIKNITIAARGINVAAHSQIWCTTWALQSRAGALRFH